MTRGHPVHGPRTGAIHVGSTHAISTGAHPLFSFLSPAAAPDELGRLGPYRVTGVLGQGGMGIVFAAEDVQLQRPVALKVLRPGSDDDGTGRIRFLREARATAALKSDHVVTIYQVGEENEVPYLAMEFLHGEPLDRRLEHEPPLTLGEVLRIGREMALGLEAAHARGLVHRDVKPGNVWLEAPTGPVKLLDFGLAWAPKEDLRLTQSGFVVGTPRYMAPEQARGTPVDARGDLFSLGCVLYRMCTGQLPFQGETTMALLTALAVDMPPPMTALNPRLPKPLSELVAHLLAKEPAHRPRSAREVAERIQAIEQGLTGPGVPFAIPVAVGELADASSATAAAFASGPQVRPPHRPRSKGQLVAVLGGALGVALLVAGLVWLSSTPAGSQPDRKQSVARTTTERPNSAAGVKPGKPPVKVFLLVGDSNMAGRGKFSTLDWLGQDPKHGPLLQKIRKPDGRWVVRNDVWVYHMQNLGDKKGPLSFGFGERADEMGPELIFGQVMADYCHSPVYLIKITEGAMALAEDGRPPSSRGSVGPFYTKLVRSIPALLARLKTDFPAYDDQGYEIAGLVWFHGWVDMVKPERRLEYELNLTNLIRDLRKDLGVPQLPVVIGEMGVDGKDAEAEIVEMRRIQATVARRPEFKGSVAVAPTAIYWDTEAEVPYKKGWINNEWKDEEAKERFARMGSQPSYLYFGSAKMNALLGQSFGDTMKQLCEAQAPRKQ